MPDKVLIFGKDAWPHTRAAREAFAKEGHQVEYYNVRNEAKHLDAMLKYSNGTRKVPVIVEGQTVTVGFDGGTWGIWIFRLEAGWKWQMTNDKVLRTSDEWQIYRVTSYEWRIKDKNQGVCTPLC